MLKTKGGSDHLKLESKTAKDPSAVVEQKIVRLLGKGHRKASSLIFLTMHGEPSSGRE
ncbi:hypothetical protein [Salipaludibacillus keqinensis]|uniref:hypothetical protein n=1 Tax=Salipaludibacillus keqinensis TaxID=2045207 RepID=UPI001304CC4E|nr:hypothetical protein [Salipaludibacillus keqinensis]